MNYWNVYFSIICLLSSLVIECSGAETKNRESDKMTINNIEVLDTIKYPKPYIFSERNEFDSIVRLWQEKKINISDDQELIEVAKSVAFKYNSTIFASNNILSMTIYQYDKVNFYEVIIIAKKGNRDITISIYFKKNPCTIMGIIPGP